MENIIRHHNAKMLSVLRINHATAVTLTLAPKVVYGHNIDPIMTPLPVDLDL